MRSGLLLLSLLTAAAVIACSQQPPFLNSLLVCKITGPYPDYRLSVTTLGQLRVECPGMPTQTVAVEPIAQHCLRGLRDCGYAVAQRLLMLCDA